jgi:hypothetical protein
VTDTVTEREEEGKASEEEGKDDDWESEDPVNQINVLESTGWLSQVQSLSENQIKVMNENLAALKSAKLPKCLYYRKKVPIFVIF